MSGRRLELKSKSETALSLLNNQDIVTNVKVEETLIWLTLIENKK